MTWSCVAGRVQASEYPVMRWWSALDHWAILVPRIRIAPSGCWRSHVKADPDPTGWRNRARDPVSRGEPGSPLRRSIKTARVADQPVPLLLALDGKLPNRQ